MRKEVVEMPEKELLEEYLAGGFGGKRSVIYDIESGLFKRICDRPFFRPSSTGIGAYKVRVDGWGPIPEIKKFPDKDLLERYLNMERICFRPAYGIFEDY